MPYITQTQNIGTVIGTQEYTLLQYTVQESGTYYATVFLPTQRYQYTFYVYLNGNLVGQANSQTQQYYDTSNIVTFTAQQGDTVTITLVVNAILTLNFGQATAVLAWYDELSFCVTYQPPVS